MLWWLPPSSPTHRPEWEKPNFGIGVHIRDGFADLLVARPAPNSVNVLMKGITLVGKARGRAGLCWPRRCRNQKAVRIHRGKAVGHGGVGKVRVQHDDLVVLRAQPTSASP